MTHTVVVTESNTESVLISEAHSVSIAEGGAVTVTSVGIQGPPGSSAGNILGGYNVQLTNLLHYDLLSFDASASEWVNRRAGEVTDGGNF